MLTTTMAKGILCSIVAFPPEVLLNFKLKRELPCTCSLAFVTSIFKINIYLKAEGREDMSVQKLREKDIALPTKIYSELLSRRLVLLFLPKHQLPLGFAQTHSPCYC